MQCRLVHRVRKISSVRPLSKPFSKTCPHVAFWRRFSRGQLYRGRRGSLGECGDCAEIASFSSPGFLGSNPVCATNPPPEVEPVHRLPWTTRVCAAEQLFQPARVCLSQPWKLEPGARPAERRGLQRHGPAVQLGEVADDRETRAAPYPAPLSWSINNSSRIAADAHASAARRHDSRPSFDCASAHALDNARRRSALVVRPTESSDVIAVVTRPWIAEDA